MEKEDTEDGRKGQDRQTGGERLRNEDREGKSSGNLGGLGEGGVGSGPCGGVRDGRLDFKKKGVKREAAVSSASEYFGVRSRLRKIQKEHNLHNKSDLSNSKLQPLQQIPAVDSSASRSIRLRNRLLKSYGGIFSSMTESISIEKPQTRELSRSAILGYSNFVSSVKRKTTDQRSLDSQLLRSKYSDAEQNKERSSSLNTSTRSKTKKKVKLETQQSSTIPASSTGQGPNLAAPHSGLASKVRAQLTAGKTSPRDATIDDYARRMEEELQAIGHRIDAIIEHSEGVDCSLKLRHSSECCSSSKKLSVAPAENEGYIEIEEGEQSANRHPIMSSPKLKQQESLHFSTFSKARKMKHRRTGSSQIESKSMSHDEEVVYKTKIRLSVSSQDSPKAETRHQSQQDINRSTTEPDTTPNIFQERPEFGSEHKTLAQESPNFEEDPNRNINIIEFEETVQHLQLTGSKPDPSEWEAKLIRQSEGSLEKGLSGRSSLDKHMFVTFGLKRSQANLQMGAAVVTQPLELTHLSEERTVSKEAGPGIQSKQPRFSSASQVDWEPYTHSKIDSSANRDYSLEAEGLPSGAIHPGLISSHSEKVRKFVIGGTTHSREPTYQLGQVLDEFVRESQDIDIHTQK